MFVKISVVTEIKLVSFSTCVEGVYQIPAFIWNDKFLVSPSNKGSLPAIKNTIIMQF